MNINCLHLGCKSESTTKSWVDILAHLSVWVWSITFETGFSCCWQLLRSICLTVTRWGILDHTSPGLEQCFMYQDCPDLRLGMIIPWRVWIFTPQLLFCNSFDRRQAVEMAGDVQRLRSCFTTLGEKKKRRQQRLFQGLTVIALVRWTGRVVWKGGMTFCRSSFSRSQECSMTLPVCLDNAGDKCRFNGRINFPDWLLSRVLQIEDFNAI